MDSALQLRIGSVATDFFLNLVAVAALVTLPIMIPFSSLLPSPTDPSRLLAVLRVERTLAEQTLAELESQAAAAKDAAAKEDPAFAAAATHLRIALARLAEENAALALRLEKEKTTPRADSLGVPLAHATDKHAVFFILANGLILPINQEAGQFTDMNVNGGVRMFNPRVAGDPVASVAAGTGLAGKAVAEMKPEKQFAFVFLRDDSFAAFYQLRNVLGGRHIALGWTPLIAPNRQVMFSTGNQGHRPDVQE